MLLILIVFSCSDNVARGRATSRGRFRLRQFGMHNLRRFESSFHAKSVFLEELREHPLRLRVSA